MGNVQQVTTAAMTMLMKRKMTESWRNYNSILPSLLKKKKKKKTAVFQDHRDGKVIHYFLE